MSLTNQDKFNPYLSVAVFRLLDTCVNLQADMAGFYRTAALEAVPGVISVFRWLKKREVKLVLLSELSPEDTALILNRLEWKVGDNELINAIQFVDNSNNPINTIVENTNLSSGLQLVTIGDNTTFLNWSRLANVKLNIGVTYGSTSFRELGRQPHHTLLDNILELPNYLVSNVIVQDPIRAVSSTAFMDRSNMQQLRLRLPFF